MMYDECHCHESRRLKTQMRALRAEKNRLQNILEEGATELGNVLTELGISLEDGDDLIELAVEQLRLLAKRRNDEGHQEG